MAEKEQISSGRQELNKIKNNIESRKIDGLTTEEKETTKKNSSTQGDVEKKQIQLTLVKSTRI